MVGACKGPQPLVAARPVLLRLWSCMHLRVCRTHTVRCSCVDTHTPTPRFAYQLITVDCSLVCAFFGHDQQSIRLASLHLSGGCHAQQSHDIALCVLVVGSLCPWSQAAVCASWLQVTHRCRRGYARHCLRTVGAAASDANAFPFQSGQLPPTLLSHSQSSSVGPAAHLCRPAAGPALLLYHCCC